MIVVIPVLVRITFITEDVLALAQQMEHGETIAVFGHVTLVMTLVIVVMQVHIINVLIVMQDIIITKDNVSLLAHHLTIITIPPKLVLNVTLGVHNVLELKKIRVLNVLVEFSYMKQKQDVALHVQMEHMVIALQILVIIVMILVLLVLVILVLVKVVILHITYIILINV